MQIWVFIGPQGGGGGRESKNQDGLIWTISVRCKRGRRPHQKIFFLAWVMNFWKSWFACNYTTRKTFKSRYPKVDFMYLLERTAHPKVLKLGLYLLWVNIYRSDLGIWEILLFSDFKGPQRSKIQYGRLFCGFQPNKPEKSKVSQIPKLDLYISTQGRYKPSFRTCGRAVLSRRYIKSTFGYRDFKVLCVV